MKRQPTPPAALAPRLVRAGAGHFYTYLGPGLFGACLLDSAATGGVYTALECIVAPGAGVPVHFHTREDETFHVLEGTLALRCGEALYTLTDGQTAHAPRYFPHAFVNIGTAPARLLIIATPGGVEECYAHLSAGEATFGDLSTAPARAAYETLLRKFGIFPARDAPTPQPADLPAPVTRLATPPHARALVTPRQTEGALLLLHARLDPDGPPLTHHAAHEAFYLLDGQLEATLGGYVTLLEPGDFVFAPRPLARHLRALGTAPATLLHLVTPALPPRGFCLPAGQPARLYFRNCVGSVPLHHVSSGG